MCVFALLIALSRGDASVKRQCLLKSRQPLTPICSGCPSFQVQKLQTFDILILDLMSSSLVLLKVLLDLIPACALKEEQTLRWFLSERGAA